MALSSVAKTPEKEKRASFQPFLLGCWGNWDIEVDLRRLRLGHSRDICWNRGKLPV